MDSETRLTDDVLDRELDEIIQELDAPFGEFPVEAIRAANGIARRLSRDSNS